MNDWNLVNLNLIAKALGELAYEGILRPEKTGEGKYLLKLRSGAQYSFSAWMGIWDHLRVNPLSIKKIGHETFNAADFFLDAQDEVEMNDIVLGNFLEEMHNSLYSDLALLKKQRQTSANSLSYWSGEKVQAYLNGHPKILLSKGRIGWGCDELFSYAPENERPVTLFWVAIKKSLVEFSFDDHVSMESLLEESFSKEEKEKFLSHLENEKIEFTNYLYLPVHPWQWNRFIKIQYQEALSLGEMIELGEWGDEYVPQISIRTLSNVTRPEMADIKLPLSILNTSAIRGIPARYISIGARLSRAIVGLFQEDELLKKLSCEVLLEEAGVSFEHPAYKRIPEAPYRYKELLGCIWRQSTSSKLKENELGIITGSLFYQDLDGHSLIGAYIEKSGLSIAEWLHDYFQCVVIPLYHLQVKYGLGLVAHGQNVILKMRDYRPVGVILKDFQGDLRFAEDSPLLRHDDFKEVAQKMDRLPKEYLIHDLLTGHLVTVLRFVSEVMEESDGLREIDFYSILASVIADYQKDHHVPYELNFLNPTLHRVLVNKVRFKVGYGDSSERPRPAVGTPLVNPLYLGQKHREEING